MASTTRRYDDIPWRGEHLPRGCRDIAKDTLYHSEWLRSIVSAQTSPSWYSPRPLGVLSQREGLALLQYCYERDSWPVANATKATFLLKGDNLMVRNKKDNPRQWY